MKWFTTFWNWLFNKNNSTVSTGNEVVTVTTPITPNTEMPMSGTGKRYVILAGSNYVGTSSQLSGCINDLIDVRKLVEPTGAIILADLRDKQMTTANWKAALMKAAELAVDGDVVFHAHSHHGSQLKDTTGTEADGLSEIWCPDDFNWSPEKMITDKWMAALIKSLKPGVIWVDWPDCCHAADSVRKFWDKDEKPRYIKNPELDDIKTRVISGPMLVAEPNRNGILLAACRSSQTSSDARIGGRPCGAFTNAMLRAMKDLPSGTYEDLMIRATQILSLGAFDQRPELDCRPSDEKRIFSKDILGK